MKRKAEKQQAAAPVSAFAARKARQQQAQIVSHSETPVPTESTVEPPSKKPRRSLEEKIPSHSTAEENVLKRRSERQRISKGEKVPQNTNQDLSRTRRGQNVEDILVSENQAYSDEASEEENEIVENTGTGVIAIPEGGEGYESPADTPAQALEFPLSKTRLHKNNIVYSDEHTLCVRIREKMSLVLIGQYDLWVKRGVVSLMGAKLHPSPRVYRVFAPSTHSLPVIKCVSGVDGEAEVEFKSCQNGIYRLRDLSPLYQRIWNSKNTSADRLSLKTAPDTRRTFSVLHTTADDHLKRHLRPLHMEKQWSAAIKTLSQRSGRLRALICGPKASGKSTFGRYLLNHLLSPAPQTESNYCNTDGVAFLDLDPGQPEFSPMGQVYLAHLRSPVFGPPFTHPALDHRRNGEIVRAHHIGATSPKEDPDHYVLAATNLMDHYRALLATYPQCPLIINYPGWIFGLGLEVATWLVKSLGLSDVVYMSEKGPAEVVEPLSQAAHAARIPLTILPSQPTEFVSRSSAQLRSMQIQSYFHLYHPKKVANPLWQESPISRIQPFHVHYSGPKQGIHGIMVLGSQINPDLLRTALEGSIVGVVAVESPTAIPRAHYKPEKSATTVNEADHDMDNHDEATTAAATASIISSLNANITQTPEDLPYLFMGGTGSSTPPDPRASHCLGLAIVRSIHPSTHQLELITPIPGTRIRAALEQGHRLILVRGLLDNPNWAISEDYYAARAAERRFRLGVEKMKKRRSELEGEEEEKEEEEEEEEEDTLDPETQSRILATLKDRVRRTKTAPWMTVLDGRHHQQQDAVQREKALWKLRKKAYPDSGSEAEY